MKKFYVLIAGLFLLVCLAVLPSYAKALSPNSGGGVYTNLCGTGTAATADSCNQGCDTGSGSCSGTAVAKFVCDGRQTDCRSNESWGNSQSLGNPGYGKTVQLDVYTEKCRLDNGNWKDGCNPVDYMVWYSGDGTSPPQENPQAPPCDPGQLNMNVSPNPAHIGDSVTFNVSGSQGSTWIGDSWSGGVDCSGNFWGSKTCTAIASGNFSWTHTWQNTAPNNFDIKSPQCPKRVDFTIQSNVVPPSSPPPPPPPASPPPQGGLVCPAGTVAEMRDNVLVCVQTIVTNNNTNNNTNTSSSTSSNSNNLTFGNIGAGVAQPVVVQPQVAGVSVSTLPKTGLPAIAWSALAFIPAGFRMRGFRKIKKDLEDDPQFIWEDRQFKAGA